MSLLRFRTGERGSAAIEFLVILPLFLAALAVVFEFGRGLWAFQIATKGTHDAARYIARTQNACTALPTSIAQNIAESGSATNTASLPYPWTARSNVTVTVAQNFTSSNFRASGCVLEVRAQVPMTLTMLNFFGIPTTITLDVRDQSRVIGE